MESVPSNRHFASILSGTHRCLISGMCNKKSHSSWAEANLERIQRRIIPCAYFGGLPKLRIFACKLRPAFAHSWDSLTSAYGFSCQEKPFITTCQVRHDLYLSEKLSCPKILSHSSGGRQCCVVDLCKLVVPSNLNCTLVERIITLSGPTPE